MRELREEQDISLRELARKLDLSAAFLSDVELGRRYPSNKVLIRIARELGVKPDELRRYDTRPPLEDLKRLAQSNPAYGVALRRIVDKPEDLIRLLGKGSRQKKKQ